MRNVVRSLAPLFLLLSFAAASTAAPPDSAAPPAKGALPKLILQITIDQLRGDLPLRYQDRFGEGGFRYLLEQGTWYTAAMHPHSFTETIVGHTTLATGAYPSRHGMIANSWYDPATDDFVHNIVSDKQPLVGTDQAGASPERILSSTFTDELLLSTAGRSKVFAVSHKDRGAVPLAGHAGKAFWFSNSVGCFVSSTFYYRAYPDWVTQWCSGNPARNWENKEWTLLENKDQYLERDRTNRFPSGTPAETNMVTLESYQFRRTFPHFIAAGRGYYESLSITPFNDQLTLDFTRTLIANEHLGEDAIPDFLGVSFSATDLISHWFSPSSLESEDNLLRLDRTLANLFDFIDKEVGLANTLIVLSGDHGAAELPEILEPMKIPTGRITPEQLNAVMTAALDARYGAFHGFVEEYHDPYVWLDRAAIAAKNADPNEVETIVMNALLKVPGVAFVVSKRQLSGGVPGMDLDLLQTLRHNQHAERSGDIYVVEKQNWQMQPGAGDLPLLQHNAPWPYDRHVPVAFAGAGVKARRVSRPISTTDVAATLTTAFRTRVPSGCVGTPLAEVLE